MKILVVDDERWIRKGIVKMIQGEHTEIDEIIEADGMENGWEKMQQKNPDIVLADVKFSVGNGCLLCEKIYRSYPKTKIIMLSGYADFEYVKSALQYKAIDYLLKPVEKSVLNETIDKAIQEIKNTVINYEEQEYDEDTVFYKSEDIIRKIKKDINEHYWEKIVLSDLACKYHINSAYLSELFSKLEGVSLVNYQMKIRTEKAETLLLMTNDSVTEISQKVGYENSRYFTRVFKKMTGMSPKEYRNHIRMEL